MSTTRQRERNTARGRYQYERRDRAQNVEFAASRLRKSEHAAKHGKTQQRLANHHVVKAQDMLATGKHQKRPGTATVHKSGKTPSWKGFFGGWKTFLREAFLTSRGLLLTRAVSDGCRWPGHAALSLSTESDNPTLMTRWDGILNQQLSRQPEMRRYLR